MRNAISLAMWTEIARVTEELGKDDSVRGDRLPRRGHARRSPRAPTSPSSRRTARTRRRALALQRSRPRPPTAPIRECPKPTVAMIFGFCMGGRDGAGDGVRPALRRRGLEVRDPRRAAEHHLRARPRRTSSWTSSGPAYAKDILFSARTVEDREALRIGFIQRLVPAAELEATPTTICGKVADNAPLSVRGTKAHDRSAIFDGHHRRASRATSASSGVETFESAGLQGGHARVPREARAAVPGPLAAPPSGPPVRIEFLTSTPLNSARGQRDLRRASTGFVRGLSSAWATRSRSARSRTRTGFHTFDRWLYNAGVALPPPREPTSWSASISTGFSGRAGERRAALRRRASRASSPTSSGTSAGWCARSSACRRAGSGATRARADRVVVPSRYSAAVAQRGLRRARRAHSPWCPSRSIWPRGGAASPRRRAGRARPARPCWRWRACTRASVSRICCRPRRDPATANPGRCGSAS